MTKTASNSLLQPRKQESKDIGSLKRKRLAKALIDSKTLKEVGEKAGFSFKARNIYRHNTKEHINKALDAMGYSAEAVKKEFERLKGLAEKSGDLSNANRSLENIARIAGHYIDRAEVTNTRPDAMVIVYNNKPLSDDKTDELKKLT